MSSDSLPLSSQPMLHVETLGSGPDIVLLHGWGVGAGVWCDLAQALSRQYRVHAVDLPGYGKSAACDPHTLDNIVGQVGQALPGPCTVCGWSLGGQLALRWALRAPETVTRLVLIATTARFVGDAHQDGIDGEVLNRFMLDLERDHIATLSRFTLLQVHGDARAATVARRLRENAAVACPVATLAGGLALLRDADLRAELADVAQPALVMHGANDAVTPARAGACLASALPRARFVELAGSGHAPFLAQPEKVARHIAEFCNG
jgi:pimeloyl-[acyl-carrier protein] methyl ester esterase